MAKTYYDLLDVGRTASADEIKRAFRREIAKYHPDKVQHLGQEFQEIAVTKAAELTQAYKTLSDPSARADYDLQLEDAGPAAAPPRPADVPSDPPRHEPAPRPAAEQPRRPAPEPAPAPGAASVFAKERAGATDLIYRATLARFRQALEGEFGRYEEPALAGFQVTCVPKPAFFSLKLPPRVLGRFVPQVDAAAVLETWALAVKMKKDNQRDLVVFVMGPKMAPAGQLAEAIAEQRRKPMPAGGKLVMVPVSTLNWNAHVPTDAPPAVKSLLGRLKTL
jgi:curved DNA-binding protein CbpA